MEICADGYNLEKLSNEYLSYVAGYIDGEGCIRATKQRNGNAHGVHVFITNTYLPFLKELEETFGGKVTIRNKQNERHKTIFQWRLSDRDSILRFLKAILPFIREKKKQAELLIEYCELPILRSNRYSNNYDKTIEARNKRINLAEEISALKKIDYMSKWNG